VKVMRIYSEILKIKIKPEEGIREDR
jgi:hypothetical protein